MEEAAEAIAWRKQPKREDLDASWKASWKEKKCTGLAAVGFLFLWKNFLHARFSNSNRNSYTVNLEIWLLFSF